MKTITQYASDIGVSYEAIRKHIKKDSKFYQEHITIKKENGRSVKYLDEEAITKLDDTLNATRKTAVVQEIVRMETADIANQLTTFQAEVVAKFAGYEQQLADKEREISEIRKVKDEELLSMQKDREAILLQKAEEISDLKVKNATLEEQKRASEEIINQLKEELKAEKSKGFWARVFNK